MHDWNDQQPIYRQLRDRIVAMILDGILADGAPLPSVRHVAAEFRVNPLTVLKAYQQLVDQGVIEMRRGLGMFVNPGAREVLLKVERERFVNDRWPAIEATIARLGLTPADLLESARASSKSASTPRRAADNAKPGKER